MQDIQIQTEAGGLNEYGDVLPQHLKKDDVLGFRCLGRPLQKHELESEFNLMRLAIGRPPNAECFRRVGLGSGSHLLKLTTPRSALDQCVLRFPRENSNEPSSYTPSVNAPDIPYAKVVYRPLEIIGRAPKSLLDHIRCPDDISPDVLKAFVSAFGEESLHVLCQALLSEGQKIVSLPDSGEFPTIFLPRPGGGDMQATPVSPAETFMGFKNMSAAWFLPQEKNAPPVPRGRWTRQFISAKPQNISGAIGGSRQRFLATMPAVMRGYRAAILRYALGGRFPNWVDDDVESAVLHYAKRLEVPYENRDIRSGTDWYADRLITGALDFIDDVRKDAREFLTKDGKEDISLAQPPHPSALLMRRKWKRADEEVALQALTSAHFRNREAVALAKVEG